MTTTQKTFTGLATLAVVFLLGFVPQYLEKRQLQTELAVSVEKLQLSEIRDLAGLVLLEALRQNYGTARDYASKYFDKVRDAAGETEDAALKTSLEELVGSRDTIMSGLSSADPAIGSHLQTMLAKTQALTRSQP